MLLVAPHLHPLQILPSFHLLMHSLKPGVYQPFTRLHKHIELLLLFLCLSSLSQITEVGKGILVAPAPLLQHGVNLSDKE